MVIYFITKSTSIHVYIFRFWAYIMTVIPEMRCAQYIGYLHFYYSCFFLYSYTPRVLIELLTFSNSIQNNFINLNKSNVHKAWNKLATGMCQSQLISVGTTSQKDNNFQKSRSVDGDLWYFYKEQKWIF